MSDKVNFSKTLFSMSAPGADYFELVMIFQHICTDMGGTLSLLLKIGVCSHVVYVKLHDLNI